MDSRASKSAIRAATLGLIAAFLAASPASLWAATPQVSSQRDHALALSKDGRVFSWGWDNWGQLGVGRPLYRSFPQPVTGLPTIVHAEAGDYHAAAVDSAGNVWTWGSDTFGALGERTASITTRPGRVIGVTRATRVVATETFTAVLRSDGTVWAWGSYVGSGPPKPIPGLSGITAIRGGAVHLVALKSDKTVWTVGANEFGQIGNGLAQSPFEIQPAQQVPGLINITKIGAGRYSSLALDSNGVVYAWGANLSWNVAEARLSPAPVTGISGTVVDVSGGYYSYALLSAGTLVSWDNNYTPVTPADLGFTNVTQFSARLNDGNVALRTGGTVAYSGRNWEGQRGLGNTAQDPPFQTTVTDVPGLSGVTLVSAGFWYTLALTSSGTLYAWGSNFEGQQGMGERLVSAVPAQVAGLPAVQKIAAGITVSYAVDTTGLVWVWGSNLARQLGDGTATGHSSPGLLAGITGVADVAAGCNFGLFRKTDGTVHYIGGGIGAGASVPTPVPGLTNIVGIAAGCVNAFAIRNDGVVYSWGDGSKGLIGDGLTVSRPTPVTLTAFDSPVRSISVGDYHVLARTDDGGVWSWGQNWSGQLGDGTSIYAQRPTPARVTGVGSSTAVAASGSHSLALLATGQLSSWGSSGLGDGPVSFRGVPGPVRTLTGIQAIAAGNGASFAVGGDGVTYGWGGTNQLGGFPTAMVGDGTFAYRDSPVLILRESALGNLDSGNWFLDLDATVPNAPPASLLPRIVPVASASLFKAGVSLSAGVNFRSADYGKNVGTYVIGFVPPAFLSLVKTAPSLDKARIGQLQKDGAPILVQLTPDGWATVAGQLIAFTSGVISGNGGATNILNGVNPAAIPGARFCIGYGESPTAMLTAATLAEVLTLEGAAGTVGDLPCLLNGVYVSGPASSLEGSAVTFTATVVGLTPTGNVQFKDGPGDLGTPVVLALGNEAVASAALTTSALAQGVHSIGAAYGGDGQNASQSSAIALVHTVSPASAITSLALAGPVSSFQGQPATFTATVTGSNPTGTVQFRDGGVNLGSPVILFNAAASLAVDALALGAHAITAVYGGDMGNTGSTSNAIAHTVYASVTTSVDLASDVNPSAYGAPVTITATVTGSNPTGNVTFRDGGAAIATVGVAGGAASVTTSAFAAGLHVITADYGGDAGNQPASASALFQAVNTPGADSVPDAFAFADQGGAGPGTLVFSNTIVVVGINVPAVIYVTGGEYSIGCGGTFTAAVGTIAAGQSVCVQHLTPLAFGATTNTTLTIGGVSGTFISTTVAVDPAADFDGDGIPNGVELVEGTNYQAKDNDVFANARLFSMQQYRDFLGREADPSGLAYYTGLIGANPALRGPVIEAFFNSPEFAGTVSPIVRLYFAFFNRIPDYAGLQFQVDAFKSGTPLAVIANNFSLSPEFVATYGALSDAQYVVLLYQNVLGRTPVQSEIDYHVARLAWGVTRGEVMAGFSESPEYIANAYNDVYVTMMYVGMLGRAPEQAGFDYWIAYMDAGNPGLNLILGFLNAPEYRNRFLP